MRQRGPERVLDEYLVASARAGSRPAFEQLAERWQGKLRAHAYRLTGEAEAARDMAQEAWVEIVRGLKRLDDAVAFPAWAYRIVTRRCARWVRGRQKDRTLAADYAAEMSIVEAADDSGDDRLERVKRALSRLPAEQRAAVALFHLDGLSVAEVALATDTAVGTVKTRLMHARRKLKEVLEGDEDEQRGKNERA